MIRSGLSLVGVLSLWAGSILLSSNALAAVATVGEPAPAWELTDLDGNRVKSSDFIGKVVLLNFFASWCVPCLWEVPDLVALQDEYGAEGLVVVGIGVQQDAATLRSFAQAQGVDFVVCPSEAGILWDYNLLPSGAIPLTTIIDRRGVVAGWHRFYHPKSFYEEAVVPLLAERVALPAPTVVRAGGGLEVSWMAGEEGFQLETTSVIGSGWTVITEDIEVSDGISRVTIETAEGSGFFRLRHPSP